MTALVTTLVPLLAGRAPLESHIWKIEMPLIGTIKVVSSMFFDIGVFLVVVAVVLVILQALGSEGSEVVSVIEDEDQ